jgi:UDP-N-acetylmuramoyl-tripeptide--D-alanyl-D-alanine ligase
LAQHIAETAAASYPPGRVKAFEDKQRLIEELSSEAKKGDVILFKASRGMKLEEVISHLTD